MEISCNLEGNQGIETIKCRIGSHMSPTSIKNMYRKKTCLSLNRQATLLKIVYQTHISAILMHSKDSNKDYSVLKTNIRDLYNLISVMTNKSNNHQSSIIISIIIIMGIIKKINNIQLIMDSNITIITTIIQKMKTRMMIIAK